MSIVPEDPHWHGVGGPAGPSPHLGAGETISYKRVLESNVETKVLVLYTGGTIGMTLSEEGNLECQPGTIRDYMKNYYQFVNFDEDDEKIESWGEKEEEEDEEEEGSEIFNRNGEGLFYSQFMSATFQLLEYNILLDSSCMTPSEWNKIMKTVFQMYDMFDSFVILHGTDTMAYTSSALSFGFRNLKKLVILSGSQIPLSNFRNDGIDNLLTSLWIAGNKIYSRSIPEVCLCFNRQLFRGTRVSKVSASGFNAFDSPNYPVLVKLGVKAKVRWNCVRPMPKEDVQKFDYLPYYVPNPNVFPGDKEFGILHLYPGIRKQISSMMEKDDYFGIVVLSFGSGNYSEEIGKMFEEMKKKYMTILVNITQCSSGKVECVYAACGKSTISGKDMNVESGFCKMMHLFSYGNNDGEENNGGDRMKMDEKKYKFIEKFLQMDLRGELSKKNWNSFNSPHYRGRSSEKRENEIINF